MLSRSFSSRKYWWSRQTASYRQSDYRNWLAEAGFKSGDIVPTLLPATVVFAS